MSESMSEIDEAPKEMEDYVHFFSVEEFRNYILNGLFKMAEAFDQKVHVEDLRGDGNAYVKMRYEAQAGLLRSVATTINAMPLSDIRQREVKPHYVTSVEFPPFEEFPLNETFDYPESAEDRAKRVFEAALSTITTSLNGETNGTPTNENVRSGDDGSVDVQPDPVPEPVPVKRGPGRPPKA